MYPVIEDRCGQSHNRWRQVQLRYAPPDPFDHSGVSWRVVAWGSQWWTVKAFHLSRQSDMPLIPLEPLGIDLGPHLAFCRGDMPAPVYADWLEDNQIPIAPEGLALLRGWILGGVERE